MKNFKTISLILIASLAESLSAQSIFTEALNLISNNNPEIKAIRAKNCSQILEMRLENRLEDPEIEFGRVWGTNTPENKWDFSISQTFDFPTLYSHRNKSLDAAKEALDLELNVAILAQYQDACQAIVELAYYNKILRIQTEIMSNLESVQTLLERAFENGEATILDVNKAKIEYVNVCKSVAESRAKREELRVILNSICGLLDNSFSCDIDYPSLELQDIDVYLEAISTNLVAMAYDAKIKSEILEGKKLKIESLPKITLGYQHEREGAESFDGFKLAISIPFFSLRGKSELSQNRLLAITSELDATILSQKAAVETDYANAKELRWLLDKMAPIFNTTNHPELLKKAYTGGELSAMSFLTELNYFRQAEADFLGAERDYYLAVVKLQRVLTRI